jgi:hypothetical protein
VAEVRAPVCRLNVKDAVSVHHLLCPLLRKVALVPHYRCFGLNAEVRNHICKRLQWHHIVCNKSAAAARF